MTKSKDNSYLLFNFEQIRYHKNELNYAFAQKIIGSDQSKIYVIAFISFEDEVWLFKIVVSNVVYI